MHKKVAKLDRDFHKFLALLGLTTQHYGHRHRSKMLTKRALPRVSGARAARRPTRPGMGAARAKSQRDRPLRALNRGTGAPGVGDVSTPSNSNRKRRRTQEEVHGAVRTRPASGRLTAALKTPRVMTSRALPSPCRPALATVERGSRQLTDEERTQLATAARFARITRTLSIKELASVWKISPTAVYDIINRQRETGSAAALPRPGPRKVLTDADESVLVRLSEELDGNYTWDEITKRFNKETGKGVCTTTVFTFCKSRGWHEVCDKYVPCLASRDVEARREWAERHLNYAWFGSENLRYPHVKDDWKVAWIDIAARKPFGSTS